MAMRMEKKAEVAQVIVEGSQLPPLIVELLVRGGIEVGPALPIGLFMTAIGYCRTQGMPKAATVALTQLLWEIMEHREQTSSPEVVERAAQEALAQCERLRPFMETKEKH